MFLSKIISPIWKLTWIWGCTHLEPPNIDGELHQIRHSESINQPNAELPLALHTCVQYFMSDFLWRKLGKRWWPLMHYDDIGIPEVPHRSVKPQLNFERNSTTRVLNRLVAIYLTRVGWLCSKLAIFSFQAEQRLYESLSVIGKWSRSMRDGAQAMLVYQKLPFPRFSKNIAPFSPVKYRYQ